MESLLLTASSYSLNNELLGTVEAAGQAQQALVDPGAVVHMLLHMMSLRHNDENFQVVELAANRVAVTYKYNRINSLIPNFPRPEGGWEHDFDWLYVIEPNPEYEYATLGFIYEMLVGMCYTYQDMCSAELLAQVEERINGNRQVANLRAALEYYAAPSAWHGNTLQNDYSREIMEGQPSVIASNALQGCRVETLPEAVQRKMDQRSVGL